MTFSVSCDSPRDTTDAGRRLAALLQAGDVVLLVGELGAGKTILTQGLAAGLGVHEAVTSPTFTLVCNYRTDRGFDLLHVDVYRLETPGDIAALGLAELLEDDAVAVIEWGLRAAPALREDYLVVTITAEDGGARRVAFEAVGLAWNGRSLQLRAAYSEKGGVTP